MPGPIVAAIGFLTQETWLPINVFLSVFPLTTILCQPRSISTDKKEKLPSPRLRSLGAAHMDAPLVTPRTLASTTVLFFLSTLGEQKLKQIDRRSTVHSTPPHHTAAATGFFVQLSRSFFYIITIIIFFLLLLSVRCPLAAVSRPQLVIVPSERLLWRNGTEGQCTKGL